MKPNKTIKLLPNYFKKASIILAGLIFTVLIILIYSEFDYKQNKESLGVVFKTLGLIPFLLFMLSKDKIEDEMINHFRLKAFLASFIWGVLQLIFNPILNLILDSKFEVSYGAHQLIFSMMIFQIFMFYLLKYMNSIE